VLLLLHQLQLVRPWGMLQVTWVALKSMRAGW